ncbi:hypothetical protein G6L34_08525 [Agrobacterium tumefaciens]|uniref:hypothetical protein n=1 Tax=Agrobacterium tumefaciens TaxID=358 RepID=UPI00157235D5|nr:hypothetical protein [Agrobacterium tumefaciens]NTA48141.1 hypothetical protein [Agrobacterium tumefaciens]
MTKVVNSSEYSTNTIFVGCSVNEDGDPLVEVNGKAVGTVDGLLEFLGKYQGQQKAKVNVKWAAAVPPNGFLGPRDYKMASPHRASAFFVDVIAGPVTTPVAFKAGELYVGDVKVKSLADISSHLANVEIKDAHIGPLSVGSTNIEGGRDERIDKLQRELDDLKSSMPRRIEEALKSASIRNIRRYG